MKKVSYILNVVLLISTLILGGYALLQKEYASKNAMVAMENAREAEQQQQLAVQAMAEAEEQRSRAMQALEDCPNGKK